MKSHLNKFVIVALLLVTVLCGATSCKSKKKNRRTSTPRLTTLSSKGNTTV